MKVFHANIIYRGRSLDVRFCAKTIKEAAEILDCSVHHVRNYVHYRKIDEPFTGVFATPYGHEANKVLEPRKEYDFEEAKKLINEYADKAWSEYLKTIKE
jgi:hypothetical protein